MYAGLTWKKLILSLSAAIDHLKGMKLCRISSVHFSWCCHYSSLVQATTLLRFYGCVFPIMPRGLHLATRVLGFWLLQSLYSPLDDFPRAFSVGLALQTYQLDLGTHSALLYVLSSSECLQESSSDSLIKDKS